MKSLGDLLKNNKLSSPLLKGVRAAKILEEAQKILIEMFGQDVLKFASPAFFKNETLTIAFLSSTAAQEFKFKENAYLERLNRSLGSNLVSKIRYMT